MDSASSPPVRKRINVLTLDGGGVRGLSSLIILKKLMRHINDSLRTLRPSGHPHSDVLPRDIFNLVAGTSTGGLISLMLGKLGMDVQDCIDEYCRFSEAIFKRKQFLAIGGLFRSRYSGSNLERCIQDLVQRRRLDKDLQMTFNARDRDIACAVVCREYENESRLKPGAVCICSLSCPNTDRLECLVCQAARATSAAPTFFPDQEINGRNFVDGSLQFNNPSHAIFQHYSQPILVEESQRESATESVQRIVSHGRLDFSEVRIVNLGAGAKADAPSRRPSFVAKFVPVVRNATFLMTTCKEIVVDPENVVEVMMTIARFSGGYSNVKYERFNANNGVGDIQMDGYKELGEIDRLTHEYLKTPQTQAELNRVGDEIARDYLRGRETEITLPAAEVQDQVPTRLQAPVLQRLYEPHTPHQQQRSPQRQLDTSPSSNRQSSGTTPATSMHSTFKTSNGSSIHSSFEPSIVPSERVSNSSLKVPSVAKLSQNGVKDFDGGSIFVE